MPELVIYVVIGSLNLLTFWAGWLARARFYRSKYQHAIGVHVCARCGEPIERGTVRQADGRWLHPHCKGN